MSFSFVFMIISLFFLPLTNAHIAYWSYSMFGRCGRNNQCVNQADPALPMRDLPFNKWWFHNYLDFPPAPENVTQLPAGQDVILQLAGNSAFTDIGQKGEGVMWPGGAHSGVKDESIENDAPYWTSGSVGNLHTTGRNDVAGCALSIAYTDNVANVRPEDFTIFSVQHQCPWHRDTVFSVPADMPPCPNGKCICSWWWIHDSNGGLDQMYQTGFQCNITHSQGQKVSTTPVGKPVPPVNCENDPSKCVKGPKMPMYWMQSECNNMPEPGHEAPLYNQRYGFIQGAQNDIFQTVAQSNYTCPQSKAAGVFHKREIPAAATAPLRNRQVRRRTFSG